jgi:very-short-patch-repair endonuclease
LAEALLWSRLRNRQIGGAKFRRQHPIGAFVVDFYCSGLRLGIEVDGGQHLEPDATSRDDERTTRLGLLGVRILRFSNLEVLKETDGVLQRIFDAVSQHPSP